MKKLLYILLFLAPLGAVAQSQIDEFFKPTPAYNQQHSSAPDQRDSLERYIIGATIDHTYQAKADAHAEKILNSYLTLRSDSALTSAIEKMDDSWYDRMGLYIAKDFEVIKNYVKSCDELCKNEIVTVSLVKKDNYYTVVILLF